MWSDASSLLRGMRIPHKSALLEGDTLHVRLGKRFLDTDGLINLMEAAGELRASVVLLECQSIRVGISYLDYAETVLRGGSLEDFLRTWSIDG